MGCDPQISSSVSLRSAVARELVTLGRARRGRLDIPDAAIAIVETVFLIAENYGSEDQWWITLEPRIHKLSEQFMSGDDHGLLTSGKLEPPLWLTRVEGEGWKHLQRVIGAAAALRLSRALKRDTEILAPPLRRGLRDLLPLARAFDLCAHGSSLPSTFEALQTTNTTDLIVQLDSTLDEKLGNYLGEDWIQTSGKISFASIGELLPLLGRTTEETILTLLADIGSPLLRKLEGARQVLGISSDDVSQCAHSLIEFTDRVMRTAFSAQEVLSWVEIHLPNRPDVIYETEGRIRPTKFADALCFLHAGCAPPDDDAVAEITARALVAARSRLQGLKHSDEPGIQEREALDNQIAIIEGAFLLVFKMGWRLAEEEALTALKERLAEAG